MKLTKNINERIDELEAALAEAVINGEADNIDCPLHHKFENGWYERTVFMPASKEGKVTIVASKIHNTQHEYVIPKGVVAVKINDGEWKLLVAPYYGITEPGTRRILAIIEDTIWRTYHKIEEGETTPEQVEERIIKKHNHPYIEMKKKGVEYGAKGQLKS